MTIQSRGQSKTAIGALASWVVLTIIIAFGEPAGPSVPLWNNLLYGALWAGAAVIIALGVESIIRRWSQRRSGPPG